MYFRKIKKKLNRGIFDAINVFEMSVFSDTYNTLSLCMFEFFPTLNFAKMLTFWRFCPINVIHPSLLVLIVSFFCISNESKEKSIPIRMPIQIPRCIVKYRRKTTEL